MTAPRLIISDELVQSFAVATGDYSSIHMDSSFARLTRFRERIAHGMLPVAAMMARVLPQARTHAIQKLSCRFLLPTHIDDILLFYVETSHDTGAVSFKIAKESDGAIVTSGSISFFLDSAPNKSSIESTSILQERLTENALDSSNITVGHSDSFDCQCAPDALTAFDALLIAQDFNANDFTTPLSLSPSVLATLPVSTLLGMRIPGRYATFVDINLEFFKPIVDEITVTLKGTVSQFLSASSRAKIDLSFHHDGVQIAKGFATTIINAPAPASIDCATIVADHVSTGVKGKVALITGSSRGIGEATAKLLAMNGANTIIHYFKGKDDANRIVADIEKNGGKAMAMQANLREAASIKSLFEKIHETWGGVDILINNAVAEFTPKDFMTLQPEDYLRELQVSLFGMNQCCQLSVPHMKKNKWGKIINIGTVATEHPVTGQNQYITVKSAVNGYTRSLAVELAPHNIQVNMVIPKMTETSLIAGIPQSLRQKIADETVTGKLLQPIEVAKAILFLASDWATPLSGQRLILNQGDTPFL